MQQKIRRDKSYRELILATAIKGNKNVSTNTLATQEGLRRISIYYPMWGKNSHRMKKAEVPSWPQPLMGPTVLRVSRPLS